MSAGNRIHRYTDRACERLTGRAKSSVVPGTVPLCWVIYGLLFPLANNVRSRPQLVVSGVTSGQQALGADTQRGRGGGGGCYEYTNTS